MDNVKTRAETKVNNKMSKKELMTCLIVVGSMVAAVFVILFAIKLIAYLLPAIIIFATFWEMGKIGCNPWFWFFHKW